jgi:hypothetical protein
MNEDLMSGFLIKISNFQIGGLGNPSELSITFPSFDIIYFSNISR